MNPGSASLAGLPKVTPSANLPSHVQSVLQEAILNGALAPGERLFVDEVAAHFGVSKIPIREALKALETAGWVQSQPRRGTYVRPLSREELRETFEMRRLLEPYSAALAAKRRTEAQLAELKGLLAQSAGHDADVGRAFGHDAQLVVAGHAGHCVGDVGAAHALGAALAFARLGQALQVGIARGAAALADAIGDVAEGLVCAHGGVWVSRLSLDAASAPRRECPW